LLLPVPHLLRTGITIITTTITTPPDLRPACGPWGEVPSSTLAFGVSVPEPRTLLFAKPV